MYMSNCMVVANGGVFWNLIFVGPPQDCRLEIFSVSFLLKLIIFSSGSCGF